MFYIICLLSLVACSKSDSVTTPDKQTSLRYFGFNIVPTMDYTDDLLLQTKVRIRVSLAGIDPASQKRTTLWDTLISKNNLQELFYKDQQLRFEGAVFATEKSMLYIVANYSVILEHKGVITTRTSVANPISGGKDIAVEI